MPNFLEGVRKFREFLLEIGAGQSTLHLPSPRMLSLPQAEDDVDPQRLFSVVIVEEEIVDVSRDLFASGHFSLAIQEAFKALEKYLQEKSGISMVGTTLMEQIFSPKNPSLVWSDRQSQSEKDEHSGYHRLFSGAMLGIRNPCTHEFKWVDDSSTALDILSFVQHLLRKAKLSKSNLK